MKRILIISFILMLPVFAISQTLTTKKDALTGKDIKTGYVYLNGSLSANPEIVSFYNDGTDKTFSVTLAGGLGASLFNNYEVDSLSVIVKFDNDAILKLKANPKFSKSMFNSGIGKTVTVGQSLTPNQLQMFIDHKVVLLRLALLNDNGYDFKALNAKGTIKIQKSANFIN